MEDERQLTIETVNMNNPTQIRKLIITQAIRPPAGYDVQTDEQGILLSPAQQIERFADNSITVLELRKSKGASEDQLRQLLDNLIKPLTLPQEPK